MGYKLKKLRNIKEDPLSKWGTIDVNMTKDTRHPLYISCSIFF